MTSALAQIPAELDEPVTKTPCEAERELAAIASRKTGAITSSLLVGLAFRAAEIKDVANAWELQRGALEAILKRVDAAKREELRVVDKPSGRKRLGWYVTGHRRHARPYRTLLRSVDPIVASCTCADYRRNSLGICKHSVAVLEHVLRSAAGLDSARGEQSSVTSARVLWNPIRPLSGPGDWLDRVMIDASETINDEIRALASRRQQWFESVGSDTLKRRRDFVQALLDATASTVLGECIDPAISVLARDDLMQLEQSSEGEAIVTQALEHFPTLHRRLYPYQRDGVLTFLRSGRLLLADDMGLGKTAQAIAAAHVLFATKRIRRALVVVPASLKAQWQREWSEWSTLATTVVDGPRPMRHQLYRTCSEGVLIVNYEQVVRDIDELRAWAPDLVVLDEAQRIKNWQTKTAATVKRLDPRWRLVLSGTPLENRLDELSSLFDWLDDTALAPIWRLHAWHTIRSDGRREAVGMRDLATLRQRIAPFMLRRLRRDLLTQLPQRTDMRIPVELTPAQCDAHDELDYPIAKLIAASKRRPLSQAEFLRLMSLLTKQRIICNGLALANYDEMWSSLSSIADADDALVASLSSPKLLEARDIVRSVVVDQQRKIVIFSQWRRMLELVHWVLRPMLARFEVKAAFFTGQESLNRRTANIVAFHDDPQTRVLLATDAGGVGLNLQRAASCVMNLDVPWNPAVLEQRIGRVHRNGQSAPVDVYNLICNAGIEARIVEIVGDKRALFTSLFDGASNDVAFARASSFMATVQRLTAASDAHAQSSETTEASDATARVASASASFADAELAASSLASENDDGVSAINDGGASMSQDVDDELAAAPAMNDGADLQSAPSNASASAIEGPPTVAAESIESGVTALFTVFSRLSISRTPTGELTVKVPSDIAPVASELFNQCGRYLSALGQSLGVSNAQLLE